MPEITARDFPFLGCCYGIGILGKHLAGDVSKRAHGEPVGTSACEVTAEGKDDPLLDGVPTAFDAFVGHKEALQALPQGCVHLVRSEACPFQMVRHGAQCLCHAVPPRGRCGRVRDPHPHLSQQGVFPARDGG